jgi:hypothetical protein
MKKLLRYLKGLGNEVPSSAQKTNAKPAHELALKAVARRRDLEGKGKPVSAPAAVTRDEVPTVAERPLRHDEVVSGHSAEASPSPADGRKRRKMRATAHGLADIATIGGVRPVKSKKAKLTGEADPGIGEKRKKPRSGQL